MKSRAYIIIIGVISVMLLLASCGKQYQAEKTVEKFVDANAEAPEKIQKRDFADLGTTRHISDSLVRVMRKRGADYYKRGISYAESPSGDLYYLRMRYVHEGDTLQNTFYLNQELTEVIAFK